MDTLISSSISLGTLFSFVDLLGRGPTKSTPYYTTVIGLALVVVSGRYLETMSRRTASEDLIRVYKPLLENRYTRLYSTGQVSFDGYVWCRNYSSDLVCSPKFSSTLGYDRNRAIRYHPLRLLHHSGLVLCQPSGSNRRVYAREKVCRRFSSRRHTQFG